MGICLCYCVDLFRLWGGCGAVGRAGCPLIVGLAVRFPARVTPHAEVSLGKTQNSRWQASTLHGSSATIGDADIVSIPDIVDGIRFLNKAGVWPNVEARRVRVENPVLGLSNLVNMIGAPEFKNSAARSSEDRVPTSSGKDKRKTVAQVHREDVDASKRKRSRSPPQSTDESVVKEQSVTEQNTIDDCLEWNQDFLDAWDSCVFSTDPEVDVYDDLPPNQESFVRGNTVIDSERDPESVTDSLDTIERNQRIQHQSVMVLLQNHTIKHNHIIATQKPLTGEIHRLNYNQNLTTALLKQLVHFVKNKKLG
ncbi:hypothetical protein AMELA_G00295940 [Ameiurus melas]|uniref:Uncharacterized protein n=1 Tax=Ameiurus melas TaxID=219545 RepID=A0A7J5ZKY6_AMEME|nr:hypothetical protein AMELA_G00295940 [Ameiurus melas]